MRMSRQMISAILVLCVVGSLSIYKFVISSRQRTVTVNLQDSSKVIGTAQAAVRIVEFTDFQCPACANANNILDEAIKKHGGAISLEHKHFPLAMHQHAMRASIFAECAAAQGKFWPMHSVLFKSQKSWSQMAAVDSYFSELSVSLGLDGIKLLACVNSPAAQVNIKKDMAEGQSLGVKSTPTFFINGKMLVGGQALTQELARLLETK